MSPDCAVAQMAQAGKYLSFRLGNEEYGLEILKVQEIVGATGITPWPAGNETVRGMIRLRGKEVPVVGLRELFKLEAGPETEKNCVIVAQVSCEGSQSATVGLLVDEVCEVLNITEEEIHFPPSFAGGMEEPDFINGMGQLADRDVILLDGENLFSEEELKEVAIQDD
jgi:purine-binding chemotaxis protein CheW